MQFDIAIDGNKAFRIEPGTDATTAQFETVLGAEVWRVTEEGAAPTELDPLQGHVSAERLVLLREMPPLPGAWPQYPSLPPGDTMPRTNTSILGQVEEALVAHAPDGWQQVELRCHALGRRMEVEATVTIDGATHVWAPPVMVSQWLHRLRMRDFRNSLGTWFTAGLTFVAGGETTRRFLIEGQPEWALETSGDQHAADELRLLPRRPEAVPDWMWHATGKIQQRGRARAWNPLPEEARLELVRAFDVIENGRGTWYRPMVGAREHDFLLRYLESAPVVLSSRGSATDLFTGGDEKVVPLGYHTDGRRVWPASVAYHLRTHEIPPSMALVDHIRQQRYEVPAVPEIAKARAAALAMGRPFSEKQVEAAFHKALEPLRLVITRVQTSPRFYSLEGHRDQAWCLVRDADWYEVYRADGELKEKHERFADVRNAVTYLIGQLIENQDALRFELDEELPAWQSPYQVTSELDPSLDTMTGVRLTKVEDLFVHRYGAPDGNLAYESEIQSDREHHLYRLKGPWTLITAVTADGARAYVLPKPFVEYPDYIDDFTLHPGLPPATESLREQARRQVPDAWLWCADPEVNPNYIEGIPDATLFGAYAAGADGELTGETYLNPNYRPGPQRRGFPEPLADLDVVLGYVAAGWAPQERLLTATLEANLIAETDGQGNLRMGVTQDGRSFIAVWSAPGHLPQEAASPMETTGRELAPVLAGGVLLINPGGQLGVELPGDDLIAALNA
ncbi:SseB family protein [Lentzea sp. BCCO 10_0061]|uniref:SseB family protein n=1 Tax=Lentzea sokolovensis TaxID=3095429 RepID=A0ABU4UUM4_9PSEU|nr:SseB family protein [Lentzea sp. BCCO 10_0061]MDX8143151.1 SseB family protein [Lentzea sp. BCCO 10_0061]